MNSDMVKLEKFGHLHLVYHFTVPLSANLTKWSNRLKQFAGILSLDYLSVFNHFVGLALKGLNEISSELNPLVLGVH